MYSDEEDSTGGGGPTASGSGRSHVVFTDDLEQVRTADPSSLLTKRQTPTALPVAVAPVASSASSRNKKGKSKASAASYSDAQLAAQQRELDLLELSEQASKHRAELVRELEARVERVRHLERANRELDLQKILMSSGARKEIVQNPAKGGADRSRRDEEWWLGGTKPGKHGKKGSEDEERASLPHAEDGIATGARVWVRVVDPLFPPSLKF